MNNKTGSSVKASKSAGAGANAKTNGNIRPDTETIDLLELAAYLLRRWGYFLAAGIVGCAIALALYFCTVRPAYKASAELYITSSDTVINVQEIQLSAALTVDYERILLSRTVLKKVINDQNLDMTYKDLKKILSVTNPEDSHCILISTTADTPQEAINITNSLIRYGVDQLYRIIGKDEPSVIDSAEADAVEVIQSSKVKYALMGALIGMLLVAAAFTLLFMTDTTLKTDEDVEKYLNLNVLAVVPESSSDRKKKREES